MGRISDFLLGPEHAEGADVYQDPSAAKKKTLGDDLEGYRQSIRSVIIPWMQKAGIAAPPQPLRDVDPSQYRDLGTIGLYGQTGIDGIHSQDLGKLGVNQSAIQKALEDSLAGNAGSGWRGEGLPKPGTLAPGSPTDDPRQAAAEQAYASVMNGLKLDPAIDVPGIKARVQKKPVKVKGLNVMLTKKDDEYPQWMADTPMKGRAP